MLLASGPFPTVTRPASGPFPTVTRPASGSFPTVTRPWAALLRPLGQRAGRRPALGDNLSFSCSLGISRTSLVAQW